MTFSLHPQAETLFLLMNGNWDECRKTKLIQELNEFGLDGEAFYTRNCRIAEKYYAVFHRYKVGSQGSQLLERMHGNPILAGLLLHIFLSLPGWLENPDSVLETVFEKELERFLYTAVRLQGDSLKEASRELVEILDQSGLSAEQKWQVVVFKQQYKQNLLLVAASVQENVQAYEHAYKKVHSEAQPLLDAMRERYLDQKNDCLLPFYHKVSPDAVLIPVLANPFSLLLLEEAVFHGVMADTIHGGLEGFGKKDLLAGAKVLSERSKLDILLALRNGALYGSEIAEQIGVTLATVSHHMNRLLASGFVTPERRDGKIYYRLSQENIRRFIEGTGELLL